jgi:hypothetical protein
MIKEIDDKPKEPARRRAARLWGNHDIEKRIKKERNESKGAPPTLKEPRIGEAITKQGRPDRRYAVTRVQTQFEKHIKGLMEGHANQNLFNYKLTLRTQKIKMLKAKLKLQKLLRLRELEEQEEQRQQQEAMAAQQAQQKPVKRDLFS